MTHPSSRSTATERRYVHRGARIKARLGLWWEASVTMPGSVTAEPVVLRASMSAGLAGVLAQARALVDQRTTASMAIILRGMPGNVVNVPWQHAIKS